MSVMSPSNETIPQLQVPQPLPGSQLPVSPQPLMPALCVPGSIIYQETDLSGHCYYGVCSLDCHVVRGSDQSCQNSTSPPATSTPPRIRHKDCPNAVPPRKVSSAPL